LEPIQPPILPISTEEDYQNSYRESAIETIKPEISVQSSSLEEKFNNSQKEQNKSVSDEEIKPDPVNIEIAFEEDMLNHLDISNEGMANETTLPLEPMDGRVAEKIGIILDPSQKTLPNSQTENDSSF
jgi:hypothetical protein